MMRFLAATLLAALASLAICQSTHMTILYAGANAGFNNHTRNPDGTFLSETELNLGSLKLTSTIKGKYEGDKIVQYDSTSTRSGGPTVIIHYDHGSVTTNQAGGDKPVKLDFDKTHYMGNICPQFTASALKSVDFEKKTPQEVQLLFLDGVGVIGVKFTPESARETAAGRARFYSMKLGMVEGELAIDDKDTVVAFDVPAQKLRFIADGWDDLYKDPLKAFPELSQPTMAVRMESAVPMKTRDGVTLVADIVRPEAEGKYPVILARTPYGRAGSSLDGRFYASRGYVYIAQDCRGRGDSGGDWDPFVHERADGYDSVVWASKLPYSTGKVGMIGASYGGLVQWAAAVEQPPGLTCLVSQVTPPDAFRNIPFDMGTFFLYGDLWWAKIVRNKDADMSSLYGPLPHPEKLGTLPLSKVDDAVLGYNVPLFDKWLERETMGQWGGYDFVKDLKRVDVPALMISGWWDGDEIGTQTIWAKMRGLGRKNLWLIYGPWAHAFNTKVPFTDIDYGPDQILELDSVYLRWFDTWLKGKSVKWTETPKVQAFMAGANRWVKSSDWPLAESKVRKLYLASDGPANGVKSKGALVDAPVANQPPSVYTFDPAKAEIPKAVIEVDPTKASTTLDTSDFKDDSLQFRTAPLAKPMVIGGPITCTLSFKTSARDTDFFVSLFDIDEKGVARVFGKAGKIRASYLGGFDRRVLLVPGKSYVATVELWDTLYELKAGHRLGLFITSSMFPIYARNLGTGEPIKNATKMVKQVNSVLHDAVHPSYLTFQTMD